MSVINPGIKPVVVVNADLDSSTELSCDFSKYYPDTLQWRKLSGVKKNVFFNVKKY